MATISGKSYVLARQSGRHHCCNYRGPLSITSPSQSRCEDIVAHKHSRDFRMWCARVQWITAWGPHSRSRAALINAYILPAAQAAGCRWTIRATFPMRILSLPTPASDCRALAFCHRRLSFPFRQWDLLSK